MNVAMIKHSGFSAQQSDTCSCSFTQNTDLGNEDQAERDGAAKDDHQRHDAELDVGLVPCEKRHGGTDDAHDAHVVNAHPDVFAVVESRNAHVPGLPCQEAAK